MTTSGTVGECKHYEVWLLSFRNDLTVTCLCTYSCLRGATFEVLPLRSYALSPTMLPLLETFMKLFLWSNFLWRLEIFWMSSISWNLRPFKPNFISEKSQKSSRNQIRGI